MKPKDRALNGSVLYAFLAGLFVGLGFLTPNAQYLFGVATLCGLLSIFFALRHAALEIKDK